MFQVTGNSITGSLLDAMLKQRDAMVGKLGPSDNRILEEHLESIREMELSLQRSSVESMSMECKNFAAAGFPGDLVSGGSSSDGPNADFEQRLNVMFQLVKMGFSCDRTRVVTFKLNGFNSKWHYKDSGGLDAAMDYHSISHSNEPKAEVEENDSEQSVIRSEKHQNWQEYETMLLQKVADFQTSLAASSELADAVMTMVSSGMGVHPSDESRGGRHFHDNLMFFTIGGPNSLKKGKVFRPGNGGRRIDDFYLAVLQAFVDSISSFASSDQPFPMEV